MKKALFLIFHGFDPNNGISKKISYQVNALRACGMEVHLCYMDESSSKKRMVDDKVIADYGNGTISKIKKRIEFASIVKYAKNNDIEFVYITSTRSRPAKWQKMIADIPGEHYFLTVPQFDYLMKKYESEGIPTYVLYDKTGNRSFQSIGFHGIEPIRQAIEEALK